MLEKPILLKKVRVHNLQGVDLALDPNQLIVFTGVSGSGKSSLAFDTLFVEGQRRYVESLSTFARRHLGDLTKPDMESAEGLSPTIAIEQKSCGKTPRSTVGTMTEIYDYLRVLFARVGTLYCPESGVPLTPQSREAIILTIQERYRSSRLMLLAPLARGQKGEFKEEFETWKRRGFMRVRVDQHVYTLEEEISLDRTVAHDVDLVIDRVTCEPEQDSRIAEGVTTALDIGKGICVVVTEASETLYSVHAFSPLSGKSYPALEPTDFSFNSPFGMCTRCQGIGEVEEFDLQKVIDYEKSIAEDCCLVGSSYKTVLFGNIADNLARLYHFDVHTPFKNLSRQAQEIFLYGTGKRWICIDCVHPTRGSRWTDRIQWKGVLNEAKDRLQAAQSERYQANMRKLMHIQSCPDCKGTRLAPYPSSVRLGDKRIWELTNMNLESLLSFFQTLILPPAQARIALELCKEIDSRLQFLLNVGLHYLTLARTSPTLSGGEAQRVRLAAQVGCGLVGVTYVLDEPSIGLHPRDNQKLLTTLKELRDRGNTVVVVEHDEETIRQADRIIDFGPKAGREGGRIIVDGTIHDLLASPDSLTGAYLSGRRKIKIPSTRRSPYGYLTIRGASHHNLRAIDVAIPLGVLVAVTGVSGSGKSSLITDTLYPALCNTLHRAELTVGAHQSIEGLDQLDKVIAIDQSPIGRNPRSNPSTYVKIFDEIRELFSRLPESMAREFTPGRFSFNVPEGSCSHCMGMGATAIDMDFMEAQWITCPTCQGRRFDEETLSVRYKSKNISEILDMTIAEAAEFFIAIPSLSRKLKTLLEVGLGYVQLGQPSTTLSGGEAQRVKLAKELCRPSRGHTLYILDEPTTGLHFYDIEHLLGLLHGLTDRGNTVLVIEHNMDVIKTADWILDMGPEGGEGGGTLVARGSPEEIAQQDSPTGLAVRHALSVSPCVQASDRRSATPAISEIVIEGACQNNLKHLSLSIPRGKITVCTGPSGSGKSSLAFETLYAEGQRRYIESLSPYARQFVQQMSKPKVTKISGLSPALAIEQKAHGGNPRSTVGTLTEIYDYLRLFYARLGVPHCPETGEVIRAISKDTVIETLLALPAGLRVLILAPLNILGKSGFDEVVQRLRKQGFLRLRVNGEIFDLQEPIPFNRRRKNRLEVVVDRLKTGALSRAKLADTVELAAKVGEQRIIVVTPDRETNYNLSFSVESTGKSYPPITPHSFSFNRPDGMCSECQGLGVDYGANVLALEGMVNRTGLSLLEWLWGEGGRTHTWAKEVLELLGVDLHTPIGQLDNTDLHILLSGSSKGIERADGSVVTWRGIHPTLALLGRASRSRIRERMSRLLSESPCPSCLGERLHPLARHVRLRSDNQELSIGKLCQLPVAQVLHFLKAITLTGPDKEILQEVHRQLESRLTFLCEVGLDYLALHRSAPSLSNGEAQRIRLARQLGGSLSGVLYVLDEPTVGLHPQDNERLAAAIIKLKELGNTILMVEHDPLTMRYADHIIDFGPHAGKQGGYVVAQGSLQEIQDNPLSVTGPYLSGHQQVSLPAKRRQSPSGMLTIKHANRHNLKNVSASFPLGAFSCVTGPSGAGKSTLIMQLLAPAINIGAGRLCELNYEGAVITGAHQINRVVVIDQDPIGHTARADVGTYVDLLSLIRSFYAKLPRAVMHGLAPASFSTNHRKGMCSCCRGMGYLNVQLQFMPPVRSDCTDCGGLRLNPLSLEVEYAGLNFGKLLTLTVHEAHQLFVHDRAVMRKLDTLISVGLGYLTLGQEVATLSGGEAQRLKISRELSKRSTKSTLYILDEPTTGLHYEDIQRLVTLLHQLVDKGATLIAIEHNLDFIKQADHVFDFGPGSGEKGGYLLASGTPENLAQDLHSVTGSYLTQVLST